MEISGTTAGALVKNLKEIICVSLSDSIAKALEVLSDNSINAIGVRDNDGDFEGIVTISDIMAYICFGSFKIEETPDKLKAKKSIEEPLSVMFGQIHEETKKIWNFPDSKPLTSLMKTMTSGVHYVIIECEKDHTFKLLSQHDVVKFLLDNKSSVSNASKSVEELHLHNPSHSGVKTVFCNANEPALTAFRRMEITNHSAVPVISSNDSKEIIGTISASDLRYVSNADINVVTRSCTEFLKTVYPDGVPSPLTCTKNTKLIEIMEQLITKHLKVIWVVDENSHYLSTVSLTDVINSCM